MASPLTVTSTTALGINAGKGLNGQAAGETAEGGLMGIFAALLGGAAKAAGADISQTGQSEMDLNLGNLIDLSFGFGSEGQQGAENPDALAAVINAVTPIQTSIDATPLTVELTAVLDGLADLKASLDAGEPLDPELLKDLSASLDALGEALDIDLTRLPDLAGLSELVASFLPEQVELPQAQLTAALAPLADALSTGTAATETSASPELSTLIKSVGDKLASLLRAINSGDVPPDSLAALGLDAETDLDPELDAAIQRLLATLPKADASVAVKTPELATPTLTLTEEVLTGKAAATDEPLTTQPAATAPRTEAPKPIATESAEAVAPVTLEGEPESEPTTGERDLPKPVAVATAAPVEDSADPQVTTLTQHQASRIDAAAAPRVVQAGYQTSQQQLNLPQIAFELVRQVNDGNTRFQMRLDPPELGRIDVKLDIDASGKVNARLTVEKAETLDLMQRDQRGLERALQQAGLDSAKTNLEFSLKQNPFSQGGQQGKDQQGHPGGQPGQPSSDDSAEPTPPTINLYRGSLTASGVNIIA